MKLFAAAVFLGICVLAVMIVVSQSGSGGGGDENIEGAADVKAELAGLEQSGQAIGDPGAPVTLIEYGDLQCPVCRAFNEETVTELLAGPIRSGEAKMEFRQWPILGDDSVTAAKAALAAEEQGAYWPFIELFYVNQGTENSGYVTDGFLEAVAEGAGVKDLDAWNEARQEEALTAKLEAVDLEAQNGGFTGTPTLVVRGPGGEKVLGPSTFDDVQSAIDEVS